MIPTQFLRTYLEHYCRQSENSSNSAQCREILQNYLFSMENHDKIFYWLCMALWMIFSCTGYFFSCSLPYYVDSL